LNSFNYFNHKLLELNEFQERLFNQISRIKNACIFLLEKFDKNQK